MEGTSNDTNQLWVHLSGLADGNIFAIYPKILEEIFLQEDQSREEDQRHEGNGVTLPSDMEWRLKAYFRLVEKQREMDGATAETPAEELLRAPRRWSRSDSGCDPWTALAAAASALGGGGARDSRPPPRTRHKGPPWGPADLAKAARLLERPPLLVAFVDDQEMRRVYSLIYDVFRYKGVLEEALSEAGFYDICPEAEHRKSLSWLLLLDQQRRRWAKREVEQDPFANTEETPRRESIRSRRKSSVNSKDSSRISRDSSTESKKTNKLSRDSSVDGKESKMTRNSLVRAKVRAVRELSTDAKEAIRKARETSMDAKRVLNLMNGDVPKIDEYEKNIESLKSIPKFDITQIAKDLMEKGGYDSKSDGMDDLKEEDEPLDSQKDGEKPIERRETLNIFLETSHNSGTALSRNDMRNVMEESAGEIGHLVRQFDETLWENRVRIAAAIAKIRIRNKALTLSELLPQHLRDERVSASLDRDILTGWVNVFKSRSITELVQKLSEMGFSYSTSRYLDRDQFRFDRHCPKFISLRPARRATFVRSSLITDNIIVQQEREFCLGAAALCRALREAQLRGDVVQTHGTSPRAAAYLAAQLRDEGGLLVFGAGDRKGEYESLLRVLGATNARVFAEGACEAAGALWAGAVAALAAPPNSYSAVADPIDLVCSRGGDLGMLEVLTESDISLDGRNRVMKILEEQKKILRLCMSKPQIQMVLYETHSALSAENESMVRRAVSEANRAARELHAQRRQRARDAAPRAPKCAKTQLNVQTEDESNSEEEPEDEDHNANHEKVETKQNGVNETLKDMVLTKEETMRNGVNKKTMDGSHEDEKISSDRSTHENKCNFNVQISGRVEKNMNINLRQNSTEDGENYNLRYERLEKKVDGKVIEENGNEDISQELEKTNNGENGSPRVQVVIHVPGASTTPTPIDPDSEYADIKVPDCDLFEEHTPSPLQGLSAHEREGCYLALIQRKELIRMNAKYMIKVAEQRGLFGCSAPQAPKRAPAAHAKAKLATKVKTHKRRLSNSQMERIAAPTLAWAARSGACCMCTANMACPACARRHAVVVPEPRARAWWRLAARAALARNTRPRALRLPRARPALALNVSKLQLNND